MSQQISTKKFAGARAKHSSALGEWEKIMVLNLVHRIPVWLKTQHLTLLTLLFSFFIILFSYLSQGNTLWLFGIILCIALQFLTDVFDGAVGRYRNTGLVKWGFYMDHFLDFIFTSSQILGLFFLLPQNTFIWILLLEIFWAGIMINSFLYFGATNHFRVSYSKLGPTEYRILLISMYLLTFVRGVSFLEFFIPILTF